MIDDFLAATRTDLDTLQRALAIGDLIGATREAHRVKGAARLVGAHGLGDLASEAEAAGRADDATRMGEFATALMEEFSRLRVFREQAYGEA